MADREMQVKILAFRDACGVFLMLKITKVQKEYILIWYIYHSKESDGVKYEENFAGRG